MATVEEMIRERDELYARAQTQEEFHRVWALWPEIKKRLERDQGWGIMATWHPALNSYWARYYELRKFNGSQQDIQQFLEDVAGILALTGEDKVLSASIEPAVEWACLFSVIIGQLQGDAKKAKEIDADMTRMVSIAEGDVHIPLLLIVANSRGLAAMAEKDLPGAIAIFTRVEQSIRMAFVIPKAWLHSANVLSNLGLARLNQSDAVGQRAEKKDLVCSAIVDLLKAEDLYLKLVPPPSRHMEGIINRLIMASYRLLLAGQTEEMAEIGRAIESAFKARDRETAISIITDLEELEVKMSGKALETEGEIPAGLMTYIDSIRTGLELAQRALETNKEKK